MLSLSIQYLLPEMGMFIKLLLLVCINNYLRHSEYIFTTLRNYLNFPKTKKKDFLFFLDNFKAFGNFTYTACSRFQRTKISPIFYIAKIRENKKDSAHVNCPKNDFCT